MRLSRKLGFYSAKRKEPPWLFRNGVENTEITGGFEAHAYVPSTSSSTGVTPKVVKEGSAITLTVGDGPAAEGGGYFTVNPINLRNSNTLKLRVTTYDADDGGVIRFGATSTVVNAYVFAAAKTITAAGVVSLDVSSLNGNYYLCITLHGSYEKKLTFTEWWLE